MLKVNGEGPGPWGPYSRSPPVASTWAGALGRAVWLEQGAPLLWASGPLCRIRGSHPRPLGVGSVSGSLTPGLAPASPKENLFLGSECPSWVGRTLGRSRHPPSRIRILPFAAAAGCVCTRVRACVHTSLCVHMCTCVCTSVCVFKEAAFLFGNLQHPALNSVPESQRPGGSGQQPSLGRHLAAHK